MDEKINELQTKLETAEGTARVDILNELGELLFKLEPDRAKEYLQEALEISTAEQYHSGIGNSYQWLAVLHANAGDLEESLSLRYKGLEAREKAGEQQAIGNSYHQLSSVHWLLGNLDEAHKYANLALETAAPDNYNLQGLAHIDLGNYYYQLENYESVLEHYFKAAKYHRLSGNLNGQGITLYNIGIIYKNLGKLELANTNFLDAHEVFEESDQVQEAAHSKAMIAGVYIELNELEQAEKTLQSAYDTATKYDGSNLLMRVLRVMTELKYKQEKYDEAISFGTQALDLSVNSKNYTGMILCHVMLGQALHHKGDWELAEHHLLEALKISQKEGGHFQNWNAMKHWLS